MQSPQRISKSSQSYRNKIHTIGNPYKEQHNKEVIQKNLSEIHLKQEQINHPQNIQDKTQTISQKRLLSPQSNRSKSGSLSYHQVIRGFQENPLIISGEQAAKQHVQQLNFDIQNTEKTNELDTNTIQSPWSGQKRDMVRTASPTQGRNKNYFKENFTYIDRIQEKQGMIAKNTDHNTPKQMNMAYNPGLTAYLLQNSVNTKFQQYQTNQSPMMKNSSYFSQQSPYFTSLRDPFQPFQSNNIINIDATSTTYNRNIFSNQDNKQNIFNRPRLQTYTSHRLFRPQKLGIVSKKPTDKDMKQLSTNNNNSNYYYLTDKNKQWNQVKNEWLGSLSTCLFSSPVKMNINNQSKPNFHDKSKQLITRQRPYSKRSTKQQEISQIVYNKL